MWATNVTDPTFSYLTLDIKKTRDMHQQYMGHRIFFNFKQVNLMQQKTLTWPPAHWMISFMEEGLGSTFWVTYTEMPCKIQTGKNYPESIVK